MDQSTIDRLFPIPAHQHKAAFYQEVLSKFWFVYSVSSLLTIRDRHCMLGMFLWVGSGFMRREGGGMGQVKYNAEIKIKAEIYDKML